MDQPTSPVEDEDSGAGLAAWLAIPLERWYREVSEANPERIRHDGPCGQRFLCDRAAHRVGGYPAVEMLPNGTIVLHCEGTTLTPNQPEYRERLARLRRREEEAAPRRSDDAS